MVNIEGISKEALLLELLKNAGKISSEDKYENIGYAAEYLKSHKYYFEGIDFSSNQIDETFYEKKYGVSVRKIVDDLKLNPNKYKFNPLDMFKVIEENLTLVPESLITESKYYDGSPFCGIYQSYEKRYLRKKVVTNSSVNLAHVQDYYKPKYAIVSIEDKPINLKDGYLYGIIRDMSGAVPIELRDHGDSASECIILDKSDFPKDFVVGDFVRLSGDFLNKGEKRDCIRHLSSNDINVSKITKDNKQEILEYGDIDLVIYFGKIDFLSSFLKVCETNDYYKIKSVLDFVSKENKNTITSEVKSTILDVLIEKEEEIIKNFIRFCTKGRKIDDVSYSLYYTTAEDEYVSLLIKILYTVFNGDISEFNSNYIPKARKKHAKIRDIENFYNTKPSENRDLYHSIVRAKLPNDLEKIIELITNYIKSDTYNLSINRVIYEFIFEIRSLVNRGVLDKNKILKMLTGLQTAMISTDNLKSCIYGDYHGFNYIFSDFPELFYQLEKAYPQYYFYNLVFNHKKLIETDEELYMKQMEEFSFDVVKMNDIECMKNFVSALDSAELSEKFEQKKQEIILRVKKIIDDLKSKDPKYVEEFVKRVEQMELIFKKEQDDCVSYSKALSNFNKDIENNIRPSQYSNEMQNLSCYSYMFGQGEYSTCKKEINSKEIVKLLDVFVGEVQTRIYSSQSEKARKYYITDAQNILKGSFEQFCTKKEEFSIEDRIFFEMLALNTLKQIKRLQTEIYSINSEELNTMINTLNSYYESDIKLYQEKTGLSFKDSSDVSISISNTGQEYPGSGEGGMSSK